MEIAKVLQRLLATNKKAAKSADAYWGRLLAS